MRSLFLLIIFFVVIAGCVRKNKIPEGVLPQNQMRMIIWDLLKADAFVSNFILKDSSKNLNQESNKLYDQIFKLHSTDRQTFKESLAFYQSRPDLFKVIADSLRIDERKTMEYQNSDTKPAQDTLIKAAKDSLQNKRKVMEKRKE